MRLCCSLVLAANSRLNLGYRSAWGNGYFGNEWDIDFYRFRSVLKLNGKQSLFVFTSAPKRPVADEELGLSDVLWLMPRGLIAISVFGGPTLCAKTISNFSRSKALPFPSTPSTIVVPCPSRVAHSSWQPTSKPLWFPACIHCYLYLGLPPIEVRWQPW